MTTSQDSDVGHEVDSQCLKCKGVTNHIIIAVAEGEIAKVECKVCGAKHKFRPPQPEKKKAVKKKTAEKKAPKKTKTQLKAEAHFEEVMKGQDPATAKPYSMTGLFRQNELIDHPTFGLGVITAVTLPNKIKVIFKTGSKLLICKLKNPYA